MNPAGVRLDSVPTGGQALSPTQGQTSETWWSVLVPSLAQPTLRSRCLSAALSPLPCHLQTQTSGSPLERGVSPSETGSSGRQHCTPTPTGQGQVRKSIQLCTTSSRGTPSSCLCPDSCCFSHGPQGNPIGTCRARWWLFICLFLDTWALLPNCAVTPIPP